MVTATLQLNSGVLKSAGLAAVGYEDDSAFLHIKSHRKNRVLLEAKIDGGSARLRCRSCDR